LVSLRTTLGSTRVAELLGSVMGCLDCFLGFYSKFIKLHISSSLVLNHSKTRIKIYLFRGENKNDSGAVKKRTINNSKFFRKSGFCAGWALKYSLVGEKLIQKVSVLSA